MSELARRESDISPDSKALLPSSPVSRPGLMAPKSRRWFKLAGSLKWRSTAKAMFSTPTGSGSCTSCSAAALHLNSSTSVRHRLPSSFAAASLTTRTWRRV